MNYFAHGRQYVDQPYVLAGTAVPDWLSVVDRRARVRARSAGEFVGDADPLVAAMARGILQHLNDDGWFHATRAFAELNLRFTTAIRECLSEPDDFRAGFLGHILVEILLDAALIEEEPDRLEAYYHAVDSLNPEAVSAAVNQMATRPAAQLACFIPRFSAERFLYDYAEDGKLLGRLNQVMKRVGLPLLPTKLLEFFPAARQAVRQRQTELLSGPQ